MMEKIIFEKQTKAFIKVLGTSSSTFGVVLITISVLSGITGACIDNLRLANFSLLLLALGLAFIAIYIAHESDERMKTIADLINKKGEIKMTDTEVMEEIKKAGRFTEIYQRLMSFKAYTKGGKEVDIEVLDGGPDYDPRYHVTAKTEQGEVATTNGGNTINIAIATTHWHNIKE